MSHSPRRSVDPGSPESPFSQRSSYFPSYDRYDRSQRPGSSSSRNPTRPRRGSTASTTSSIGGTLDTSHNKIGTVTEIGQNAISTLLQPPIIRTGLLPHTSAPLSSIHKPPSTKDIPPVTLTNIPHIENSAFKPYLAQVGSLFDAFQRAKSEEEGSSQLFRRDKDAIKDDEFAALLEKRLQKERAGSVAMSRNNSVGLLSPSPSESPQPRRRSSGGFSRRNPNAVTPLSTIPNVYFDQDFHLENPRTFDVVSERSEIVRPPPGKSHDEANGSANGAPVPVRKALATNAILQEKLSWYMDTVEVHLISSIASASSSFFAALGSLKELQSEAADSVARIQQLRQDLAKLDKDMAMGGLEVIQRKKRRENLRSLSETTSQLQSVVDGATHCEELAETGELETAIGRIGILEDFVCGHLDDKEPGELSWLSYDPKSFKLRDLRRLKALDGISDGMDQLRSRIGKGYETRFLESLLNDLRQHVGNVPPQDTLRRWSAAHQRSRGYHNRAPSGMPAYLNTSNSLRSDLVKNLKGLSQAKHTSAAASAFRDAVMREMKSLIRQHLPSSTDDDADSVTSTATSRSRALTQQDKSSILARNLRALDPETAEDLFTKTYAAVGEALRRLSVQVKVLLDVTSSFRAPASPLKSPMRSPNLASPAMTSLDGRLASPAMTSADGRLASPLPNLPNLQEELSQALDMSSLLGQAVDVAQTQITKVLKVRSEQTAQLSPERFLRYFTLNRLFADECEAISGRSGAALKSVINNHIGDFVSAFGESERQQLTRVMDKDRWEAKDFTVAHEAVLRRILDGMNRDPPEWLKSTSVWEAVDVNGVDGSSEHQSNGTSTEKSGNATIDEEKFILVESALVALRGIEKFETIMACIPNACPDVSSALVEYLKLFNSRSCQLVLGAGATSKELAGLRNINTKHLALASQALSFIVAIIPYVREFVRRHAPSARASLEAFDTAKRSYQDHQNSLQEKFIDIMSGRATAHVKEMRKIDFDKTSEQQLSTYMETLVKESTTLHRVLSKHLPEITVRMIMLAVFSSYREQWGDAFRDAKVTTAAGKARLMRDAELFDSKLSKIDGSGDTGAHLKNLVEQKSVKVTAPRAAPTPPISDAKKEDKSPITNGNAPAEEKPAAAEGAKT